MSEVFYPYPVPPSPTTPGTGFTPGISAPVQSGPARSDERVGLAVTGFVFGVIGWWLPAIIIGHVALGRVKRGEVDGKGFALAGTILGYYWGVTHLVFLLVWVTVASTIFASLSSFAG